jgi:hypothetical protein
LFTLDPQEPISLPRTWFFVKCKWWEEVEQVVGLQIQLTSIRLVEEEEERVVM